MNARTSDHGVPVILGTLQRSVDWTEPAIGEGEWLLNCSEAGDDDDR